MTQLGWQGPEDRLRGLDSWIRRLQGDIKTALIGAVIDHMDVNNELANQVLNNPTTLDRFTRLLVDLVYEGFERRRAV